MTIWLAWVCAGGWLLVLLVPWRPWGTRENLDSAGPTPDADLSDVTVLIPARNEALLIGRTLKALRLQGRNLRVVLVDDQSHDGTAEAARWIYGDRLHVITGADLPPGWTGKSWALEQGRRAVHTRLMLLLDADIELMPGTVAALRGKLLGERLQLVSLMARLRMTGLWERLLLPAFIYFFKLLYPFRLANSPRSRIAAAAGGCILLESKVLDTLGGFAALRETLIDDCALARRAKSHGYRAWIGLTRSALSHRDNRRLLTIWRMVTRTAYTQLGYSAVLLILASLVMIIVFLAPIFSLASAGVAALAPVILAWMAMVWSYIPVLRYYGLNPFWAAALPLTATLYLGMTWSSALAYWSGVRSRWKERVYWVRA